MITIKQSAVYNTKIGSNLRTERIKAGRSQQEVASVLGITFQQLQKYEKGHNRISAGGLYVVSKYLNVPIDDFYNNANKHSEFNEKNARYASKITASLMKINNPDLLISFVKLINQMVINQGKA